MRRWGLLAALVVCGVVTSGWAQQGASAPADCGTVVKEAEGMRARLQDWAGLKRYAAEDAAMGAPKVGEQRVVFLGDSITDAWGRGTGEWFAGKPWVNRGISGQTTPQMLVRFEQDVVRLRPVAVVVLAGVNDVAGNTGPETVEAIEDNYRAMEAVAKGNGIRVVWASVLPADRIPWRAGVQPAGEIRELNVWLKGWAAKNGDVWLDYYSALVNGDGGMREGLSKDGVHPTAAGYAVMAPLAEKAVLAAER